MCGRTCCTLAKGCVPLACSTVLPDGQIPEWRDAPCGGQYWPSTNVPPTAYTPILVRGEKVGVGEQTFVVQPMMWGLVPFWHKGSSAKNHGLTTNNARIEGIKTSRLYKHALVHSKRCVVICDGFYEWKTFEDKTKQPYLIYAPQNSEEMSEQLGSLNEAKVSELWSEEKTWKGPRPLFMAGIFSIWNASDDPESKKPVYSFSIITRDSTGVMEWLHERIPAILPDAESVQRWLDPSVEGVEAVDLLKPITSNQISWHPVSSMVGNVRNKGAEIPKKVNLDKNGKAIKKEGNSMTNWLVKKQEVKKEDVGKNDKSDKRENDDKNDSNVNKNNENVDKNDKSIKREDDDNVTEDENVKEVNRENNEDIVDEDKNDKSVKREDDKNASNVNKNNDIVDKNDKSIKREDDDNVTEGQNEKSVKRENDDNVDKDKNVKSVKRENDDNVTDGQNVKSVKRENNEDDVDEKSKPNKKSKK